MEQINVKMEICLKEEIFEDNSRQDQNPYEFVSFNQLHKKVKTEVSSYLLSYVITWMGFSMIFDNWF